MSAFTAPASTKGALVRTVLQGASLRALFDARKSQGRTLTLDEAIAIAVPLCLDLKGRHDRGERNFVHPSCIVEGPDGLACVQPKLATAPGNPRDRACLAPELQAKMQPGDARSSVFAVGAILYEAVTGHAIGPGMRRPKDVDPSIPDSFEVLIAKALVADPNHRPDDLGALASAMHHLAPMKSIHPPDVDESRLDRAGELEVDIRLSMLPPTEARMEPIPKSGRMPQMGDPFGNVVDKQAPTPSMRDATTVLAQLKARLESDTRPRYVVNKDRMDHGPFSAVELLQQIASHTFTAADILRDELSGQSRPLPEWEEFAPFIEHAARHREIKAEKAEVARVEKAEKKGGIAKFVIGLLITGAVGAIAALVYFKIVRPARSDDIQIDDDQVAFDMSIDAGVKGFARTTGKPHGAGGRGGGGRAGGGGFSGGTSYESALDNNNETITMGGGSGQPDLTNAQLAAPMQRLNVGACGAPNDMKVVVRVAVKQGRAVGVSIVTQPQNPSVAACIDRSVRGLSWPPHPKMDSFTTVY
jgi:hypothetical protein